jgi:DNA mismatch repair ATPase MutS
LPEEVLERARTLLSLFEGAQIVSALGHRGERGEKVMVEGSSRKRGQDKAKDQLALFGPMAHPIVDELKQLDPNAMTPIDALTLLNRLVARARQG